VGAVVNTVTGDRQPLRDGFLIRRAAVERRLPCFTSLDTLRAALDGLSAPRAASVRTVDEYRGSESESELESESEKAAQSDGVWPGTPVPAGHIVGVGRDEVPADIARRARFNS
jgi:hypothetical protein